MRTPITIANPEFEMEREGKTVTFIFHDETDAKTFYDAMLSSALDRKTWRMKLQTELPDQEPTVSG